MTYRLPSGLRIDRRGPKWAIVHRASGLRVGPLYRSRERLGDSAAIFAAVDWTRSAADLMADAAALAVDYEARCAEWARGASTAAPPIGRNVEPWPVAPRLGADLADAA